MDSSNGSNRGNQPAAIDICAAEAGRNVNISPVERRVHTESTYTGGGGVEMGKLNVLHSTARENGQLLRHKEGRRPEKGFFLGEMWS